MSHPSYQDKALTPAEVEIVLGWASVCAAEGGITDRPAVELVEKLGGRFAAGGYAIRAPGEEN